MSLAAPASRSNATTSPTSKSAIVYFYQTVIGDCPNTTDSLVVLCLEAWEFDAAVRFDYYGPFDDEPEITLEMLRNEIAGAGFAYIASRGSSPRDTLLAPPYELDPPVYLPPSAGGDLGCEWYAQYEDATAAAYDYLLGTQFDYAPGDLWVAGVNDILWNYWTIILSPSGMGRHINTLAGGAIFHGQFDHSADEPRVALTSAATFVGYEGSLLDVDECAEAGTFYSRLCCQDYPAHESRVGSAAEGLDLVLYGDADNWMDADRSCENLATHYKNVRATRAPGGATVSFGFDAESDAAARAHRVRGFRAATDYPAGAVPLARLAAPDDARWAGRAARYTAEVPSGFALYDVVEESAGPRGSWSAPVLASERAPRDSWPEPVLARERDPRGIAEGAEAAAPEAARAGGWDEGNGFGAATEIAGEATQPLFVFAQNEWRRWDANTTATATPAAVRGSISTTTDICADCADYVVYVNAAYPDWAAPVRDSLVALGFDVAVFSGPSSLISARAPLASTLVANAVWNATCSFDPPCARTYPVTPGPTLVVVGDANPVIVSPMSFANPTQCLGSNCRSYVLVADLNADSIPDCPVEVIPANTLDEVRAAAAAGVDLRRGRDVDAGRHIVLVGGDRDAGGVSPWVGEFLDETASLYPPGSIAAGAPILESAFPIGDNYAGIQTATRDAMNSGAAEAWFFGLRTDELKFPAWCISDISDPANLTRRQRIVVWAPGCRMGAVQSYDPWNYDQPPTSERLAFNSSDKSVMAGGVFHLDPAYGVKHYTWSRILRDARVNAPAGTAVSRIHYDAVRAWCSQFPGDRYALSTVTLGCGAALPDVATATPIGGDALDAAGPAGDLVAANTPGTAPVFRFSLRAPARGSLRIVDVTGRVVATLRDGEFPAGAQQYTWFGATRDSRAAAAGVYFGVLRTLDGRNDVAKAVIVR